MELNIQLGYCQSQRAQFVYFAYHLTRTMMHQEGMQYFDDGKKPYEIIAGAQQSTSH